MLLLEVNARRAPTYLGVVGEVRSSPSSPRAGGACAPVVRPISRMSDVARPSLTAEGDLNTWVGSPDPQGMATKTRRKPRERHRERPPLEPRCVTARRDDPGFDHGVKLVAILSMVVDHVGMVFYPEKDAIRIAGRLAMPLFAYLVAVGVHRTSNRDAYLCRLLALFVVSQFPYGLFVGTKLNVFLPLLIGALVASYMIERKWVWAGGLALAYAGFAHQHDISYGVTGPLLVVAFAATRAHLLASTGLAAAIFLVHGALSGSRFSQMAVFVVPLVPLVVHFVHWNTTSKWRWAYWVYPAHLALFYLFAWHLDITEFLRR